MDNFRIHFEPTERETVLTLLSRSNDIVINNIDTDSVSITIQRDDAEPIYRALLDKIDREIYATRHASIANNGTLNQ